MRVSTLPWWPVSASLAKNLGKIVEVGVAVSDEENAAWCPIAAALPLRSSPIHKRDRNENCWSSHRAYLCPFKESIQLGWDGLQQQTSSQVLINALGGQMTDYDNKRAG